MAPTENAGKPALPPTDDTLILTPVRDTVLLPGAMTPMLKKLPPIVPLPDRTPMFRKSPPTLPLLTNEPPVPLMTDPVKVPVFVVVATLAKLPTIVPLVVNVPWFDSQ